MERDEGHEFATVYQGAATAAPTLAAARIQYRLCLATVRRLSAATFAKRAIPLFDLSAEAECVGRQELTKRRQSEARAEGLIVLHVNE